MDTKELERINKLIDAQKAIRIDIGCGGSKMPGFLGIDIAPYPGVDVVWNIENTPWPFLEDESVITAVASHVMEHISPHSGDRRVEGLKKLLLDKGLATEDELLQYCGLDGSPFINVMNELWRVMRVGGQFAFVVPHAASAGFQQDPTHINMINQHTMCYFDPLHSSNLYRFYQPKPWKIEDITWSMNGNVEVVLRKRADDPSYHQIGATEDITKDKAFLEAN